MGNKRKYIWDALFLFRDRFRLLIVSLLDPENKGSWEPEFRKTLFGNDKNQRHENWIKTIEGKTGKELIECIDFPHLEIFADKKKYLFKSIFGNSNIHHLPTWLHEIKEVRNKLGHVGSASKAKQEDIDKAWIYMEQIAEIIGDKELQGGLKGYKSKLKKILKRKKIVIYSILIILLVLFIPFRSINNKNIDIKQKTYDDIIKYKLFVKNLIEKTHSEQTRDFEEKIKNKRTKNVFIDENSPPSEFDLELTDKELDDFGTQTSLLCKNVSCNFTSNKIVRLLDEIWKFTCGEIIINSNFVFPKNDCGWMYLFSSRFYSGSGITKIIYCKTKKDVSYFLELLNVLELQIQDEINNQSQFKYIENTFFHDLFKYIEKYIYKTESITINVKSFRKFYDYSPWTYDLHPLILTDSLVQKLNTKEYLFFIVTFDKKKIIGSKTINDYEIKFENLSKLLKTGDKYIICAIPKFMNFTGLFYIKNTDCKMTPLGLKYFENNKDNGLIGLLLNTPDDNIEKFDNIWFSTYE